MASSKNGGTDTTTVAQGRITVALPAEFGPVIDKLQATIGDQLFAVSGVRVELTRAQIVQSCITTAASVAADMASEEVETVA